ncbi:MAG: TIGR03621 family F420-dependent LLM class oxidoreductase [Acidimicrobiales bacterium]
MVPFRFGVQLKSASSATQFSALLRRIEEAGFDFVSLPDHLDVQLSPMVALGFAAGVTSSLGVASLVLNADLRHPVEIAREANTLAHLAPGRCALGLGAGWDPNDYLQLGRAFESAGTRITRFEESLEIITTLFATGHCDHEGPSYRIENASLPYPDERPELWIGGGGSKLLRLATRYADVVGINPRLSGGSRSNELISELSPEAFEGKVEIVREEAERVGRIPELQCRTEFVYVGEDFASMVAALAPGFGIAPELVYDMPPVLVGTADLVAETLVSRRERFGVSNWVIHEDQVDLFVPVLERVRA